MQAAQSKTKPVSMPETLQIALRTLKAFTYILVILGLLMPIYSWEDPPGSGKSFVKIFLYRHCFLRADQNMQREVTEIHDSFVIGNHTCLEFDLWDDATTYPELRKHTKECRSMQRCLRAGFIFFMFGLLATLLSTFSVEHQWHAMAKDYWPALLKGKRSGIVWNGIACGLNAIGWMWCYFGPRDFLDVSTANAETPDAALWCFAFAVVTGLGCIGCLCRMPPDSDLVATVAVKLSFPESNDEYREGNGGTVASNGAGRDIHSGKLVKDKLRIPRADPSWAEVVQV